MGVTICCPGPIATGNDGKPRSVYGASGLVQQAETSAAAKKRLDPAATAAWIGAAAYHGALASDTSTLRDCSDDGLCSTAFRPRKATHGSCKFRFGSQTY